MCTPCKLTTSAVCVHTPQVLTQVRPALPVSKLSACLTSSHCLAPHAAQPVQHLQARRTKNSSAQMYLALALPCGWYL
jgi:hypothetical protein